MKLELNIEKDNELRAYIKNLITGQVKSIVKDELENIVKKELTAPSKTKYYKKRVDDNFDKMLQDAVYKILYNQHDIKKWDDAFIRKHIHEYLNTYFKEQSNRIEAAIKQGVEERIKIIVSKLK